MATKNKNLGRELGAGAVAAAALAIASGYVLWERMGKTKQAKVKRWAAQARKEAARKLALTRAMSETEYKRIVDQAVKHYGTLAKINKPELMKVAGDMKAEWKHIHAQSKILAKEMQKEKTAANAKGVKARKKPARRRAGSKHS